jgi:hypothetical protein
VEEALVVAALEALAEEASVVVELEDLGKLQFLYLREMKLNVRTSLAGALLVLFVGVLSFQTVHQFSAHSHESEMSHEHQDEDCQYCAVKALPYLPVEILSFSSTSFCESAIHFAHYTSSFSETKTIQFKGRGPPKG